MKAEKNYRPRGNTYADMIRQSVTVEPPANRLTLAIHTMPGDDGNMSTLAHLFTKFHVLGRAGVPVKNVLGMLQSSEGESFLAEGPYPYDAAHLAHLMKIPPQYVTHVTVLLPGSGGLYEMFTGTAPYAAHPVHRIITENAPTSFGLGDISEFDRESAGATTFEELSEKARRLVTYIEATYRKPVLYITTAPGIVIDREPVGRRKQ